MRNPLEYVLLFIAVASGLLGDLRDGLGVMARGELGEQFTGADRGQIAGLGIFGQLVVGAIALVVVTITLLFGMDIAGEFASGVDVDNEYSDEANATVNSTGDAFNLFGTSVLVIPAVVVLFLLVVGLGGAMSGGGVTGGMNRGR